LTLFEEIYAQNYSTMFRVAKKMVGSKDGVSDIVQDVFIDLYDRLNHGDAIRSPKSWLYRTTCNKCIDSFRRQKRFLRIDSNADNIIDVGRGDKEDIKEAMIQVISTLKPREKTLAVLYGEGMTYKEIAEATGLRLTSIGKLLSRTLLKIEKEFKAKGYELY
jgi:RNA polymerase sigma factor (sigma-70 family)